VHGRTLEGQERKTQGIHCFWKDASSDFPGEHSSKSRKGSERDVTSDSWFKLSTNFPCTTPMKRSKRKEIREHWGRRRAADERDSIHLIFFRSGVASHRTFSMPKIRSEREWETRRMHERVGDTENAWDKVCVDRYIQNSYKPRTQKKQVTYLHDAMSLHVPPSVLTQHQIQIIYGHTHWTIDL